MPSHYVKILTVLIFNLSFVINTFAQYPCGTKVNREQLSELKEFQQQAMNDYKMGAEDEIYYVPIKPHIIRKTDGTGGISLSEVYKAIDSANYYFKNASIQFTVCDTVNYIDNSDFLTFDGSEEEPQLVQNDISRVINVYFADSVRLDSNLICGYSYMPNGPLRVFLTRICINNGNTLAHELGHIFSLLHPHGTSNDKLTDELVDGSNCQIAGDNICDTPADPNLSKKVNKQCEYIGNEKDANGDTFAPLTNNIMSYSLAMCTDSLTPQQYNQINRSLFVHKRLELICSTDGDVKNRIEIVYPNPFDKQITIKYQLEKDARVSLALYNVLGEKVEDIYEGEQKKGLVKLYYTFQSSNRFPHIYILKLEIDGKIEDAERLIKWD